VAIIKKYLIILLFIFLSSCYAPHNITLQRPNNYRDIIVYIDSKFTFLEHEYIKEALNNLIYFHIRAYPTNNSRNYNIRILRWLNRKECTDSIYGLYRNNTNYILFDPKCVFTREQFIIGIQHEIGHWLGMNHICQPDRRNSTGVCSPVGFGNAIMNPFTDLAAGTIPSKLDLLEYNRIQNNH
jgi:hypothetical protein